MDFAGVRCGPCYPLGHGELFRSIREQGALVSEWPPGRMPTKPSFLVRNRVIAALGCSGDWRRRWPGRGTCQRDEQSARFLPDIGQESCILVSESAILLWWRAQYRRMRNS